MGNYYRSPFGFGDIIKVGACWYLSTLGNRNQLCDLPTSAYLDQMLAWDCLVLA